MSLFFNDIRFQIAAICFLSIIIYSYKKMKKLRLYSTFWFNTMLVISSVNMIFDIITVYTVTHVTEVSAVLNDVCHRIFIFTLACLVVALYFYIEAIGRQQQRFTNKQLLLRLLPFIAALGMVIFGDVDYYCEEDGAYSYGTMPSTIYIIVAVYMLMIYISSIRFRKTLRKERIIAIRTGMMLWVIAALIQMFHPTLLVSGLASVLLVFFLYLTFQNPKELVDMDTGAFNERALGFSVTEGIASQRTFYIIGILMKDMTELYSLLGTTTGKQLLTNISEELSEKLKENVYRSGRTFKIIFFEGEKNPIQEQEKKILECLNRERNMNGTKFRMTTAVYILECPKYVRNTAEFTEVDNFLMRSYLPEAHEKQLIEVNDAIIGTYHRNAAVNKLVTEALHNDGLEVFYQPIFDVKKRTFSSAEALVRMKDTGAIGFVSPEEFIPMAERNGMIAELGEIVFRKVCRFGREQKLSDRGVCYIEVNLSGVQIVDENICTQLRDIMKENQTAPSFINLEITETAAVQYKDILSRNMMKLREMGCSFSMDDFGTGYSNISQMAQIRYDLIKLDKSLIWPCFEEQAPEKARVMLESIVYLVHKMGARIVAEGVETAEQVELLTSLGVEYLQGYYYSRPVRETDYLHFLDEHALNQSN